MQIFYKYLYCTAQHQCSPCEDAVASFRERRVELQYFGCTAFSLMVFWLHSMFLIHGKGRSQGQTAAGNEELWLQPLMLRSTWNPFPSWIVLTIGRDGRTTAQPKRVEQMKLLVPFRLWKTSLFFFEQEKPPCFSFGIYSYTEENFRSYQKACV